MPPVHPPIALKLSVVADLFGFMLGSQSLQHAGWWGLLGARHRRHGRTECSRKSVSTRD